MLFKNFARAISLFSLVIAFESRAELKDDDCPPETLSVLTENLQSISAVAEPPQGQYFTRQTTTGMGCFIRMYQGNLIRHDMERCLQAGRIQGDLRGLVAYSSSRNQRQTTYTSSRSTHFGQKPRPSSRPSNPWPTPNPSSRGSHVRSEYETPIQYSSSRREYYPSSRRGYYPSSRRGYY